MSKVISIAIPHYNNAEFMTDTLENIVDDVRVAEIIICDDCSNDIEKLESLIKKINNDKIILFKNEKNIGCYHNKLHTLTKCNHDWVILLDSDNIINKEYIDTLFSIETWNNTLIYAPMWAKTFPGSPSQSLNYSKFKNKFIEHTNYLNYFDDIVFKCLINTCNYFIPVKPYLQIMNKYTYQREVIDSLDSAVLFTDWLCAKNKVLVVENLTYSHRLHRNSNYTLSSSKKYTNLVENNLISKIKSLNN
jgi:glycosyltransferase involved in cell wall biosynthesis